MKEFKGKISAYMSSPPCDIESEATVQEAAKYMRDQNVGALLVTKNDKFVGMVSETVFSQQVIGEKKGSAHDESLICDDPTDYVYGLQPIHNRRSGRIYV